MDTDLSWVINKPLQYCNLTILSKLVLRNEKMLYILCNGRVQRNTNNHESHVFRTGNWAKRKLNADCNSWKCEWFKSGLNQTDIPKNKHDIHKQIRTSVNLQSQWLLTHHFQLENHIGKGGKNGLTCILGTIRSIKFCPRNQIACRMSLTSFSHFRLDEVERRFVLTDIVGHVAISVDCQ